MSDKTWYPGWATGRLLSPPPRFRGTGVRDHVEVAIHDCREHLRFVTEGLVVLAAMTVLGWSDKDYIPSSDYSNTTTPQELLDTVADKVVKDFVLIPCKTSDQLLSQVPPKPKVPPAENLRTACGYPGCPKWLIISKFYGTSTPKGSYSDKTGESTRWLWWHRRVHYKKCYGSTVELSCLRTAMCESIHYQVKSEQNVQQDLIRRVRHREAALCTP